MSVPQLVTGDDIVLYVTLKKNGTTFNIDAGATVKASIIDLDHQDSYVDPVTQSNVAVGADWANSLVVVEFDPVDTQDIVYQGEASLEIQVDNNGKITFFAAIVIISGTIV